MALRHHLITSVGVKLLAGIVFLSCSSVFFHAQEVSDADKATTPEEESGPPYKITLFYRGIDDPVILTVKGKTFLPKKNADRLERIEVAPGLALKAEMENGIVFYFPDGSTFHLSRETKIPETPLSFDGSTDELKATQIVSTLDEPIPIGKNAIWCATFLASWKELEGISDSDFLIKGAEKFSRQMTAAIDPRPHAPKGKLFTAAGLVPDVLRKFDDNQNSVEFSLPREEIETLPLDSIVAFSKLVSEIAFKKPFHQHTEPYSFQSSDGTQSKISSFGIDKDKPSSKSLFEQVKILYHDWTSQEFAIDLSPSETDDHVVLAMIERKATLSDSLDYLKKRIANPKPLHPEIAQDSRFDLDEEFEIEGLVIPDINWNLSHRYSKLEGNKIAKGPFKGKEIVMAQQDIRFRLDRNGAFVKSRSFISAVEGIKTVQVFDRPFLIYLAKRGSSLPYFAMWVDNAELLAPYADPPEKESDSDSSPSPESPISEKKPAP